MFLVFKRYAFELAALSSPYCGDNTLDLRTFDICLTYSPTISNMTKNDVFDICLAHNDDNVG